MKRKLLPCAAVLAALFVVPVGEASASVLTYTDIYLPASSVLLTPDNPLLSFTQSILSQGFDSTLDTITSASLELFFHDDGGSSDGSEKVDIYIDNVLVANRFDPTGNFTYSFTSPFANIADGLLLNKLIDVQIGGGNSQVGDFYFDQSVLTVTVDHSTPQPLAGASVSVPEPGSMALVGLAIGGLAISRRKRIASN